MELSSITGLPYSERQLIMVSDDRVVAATRTRALTHLPDKSGFQWAEIARAVLSDIAVPFSRALVVATEEAFRAWARARDSGVRVLPVGYDQAKDLSFPPGHPRDGVLYIGHPALPNVYYSMADFHRVTFEHKLGEAIELLMSLGATSIKVEHIRGWSREFSARLSVPLGDSSGGAEGGGKEKQASHILYEANLPGVEPSLPDNLVWFPHEPTWNTIAKGRLKYGLTDFGLSVSYDDDFGVNAGLKLAVSKTGLDIGGTFEDHQSTTWRLEGKFSSSKNA